MAGTGSGQAAGERREDLEYRSERDMLAEAMGEYREGWGVAPPAVWGEPWTATPRRSGLPHVAAGTLAELTADLAAEAVKAGLARMLDLEEEFPDWRLWRSTGGAWWATRQAVLTQEMQDCGLHGTVGDVKTHRELRVLLDEQTKLKDWAEKHAWQIPGDQARRELGLDPEPAEFRLQSRMLLRPLGQG